MLNIQKIVLVNNFFDFSSFKKIIKYANVYLGTFLFTILISILFSILSASRPGLIQIAFDKYINTSEDSANEIIQSIMDYCPGSLLTFLIIIFFILLLESIFQFLFIQKSNYLAQVIIRDIRSDLL